VLLPATAPNSDLFAALNARAKAAPQAVVLRHGSREVRAAELAARINTCAQPFKTALAQRPAGTQSTIAVCVADPIDAIVAAWSAWQVGAAVLALDPYGSPDALQGAIEAAAPAAVISDEAFRIHVPVTTLWLDAQTIPDHAAPDARRKFARQTLDPRSPRRTPLTQTLFTQIAGGLAQALGLAAGDRIVATDGMARPHLLLDAALALACAGTVDIVGIEAAQDDAQLRAALGAGQIALLDAPVELLRRGLDLGSKAFAARVLADANALPYALVTELRAAGIAVWSTSQAPGIDLPLSAGALEDGAGLHAGRPLARGLLEVVDADLKPAPIGIIGRVALHTATGPVPVGLQARWRADGVLQTVPSDDEPIVGGYLIDLQSLAQSVIDAANVTDAKVMVKEDRPGARGLTVFVQPIETTGFDVEALRNRLAASLPPHAVLRSCVAGAAEGAAVNADQPVGASAGNGAFATNAPATPTEQAIARVWSELLHTTNLERQDNFFHLGGTSLLAMQAVALLEQELGMRINARRYVYESLAQLAAAYDQGETAAPVVVTAKPSLIKRIAGIFQSRGNSAN